MRQCASPDCSSSCPFKLTLAFLNSLKKHFIIIVLFIKFVPFMAASSKLSDDQIRNLVFSLQSLLPHLNRNRDNSPVSEAEILREACDYIRKLQREVDDLSERLWKQVDSMGVDFEMLKDVLISLRNFS